MSSLPVDERQQGDRSLGDADELSPSVRLVLQTLHGTDGRTASQLARETGFAERTIRYALSTLEEFDVIEFRYLLSAPQTREYRLVADLEDVPDLVDR